MPLTFTIPSVYTVVDKVSPAVKAMGRNISTFAANATAAVERSDRAFRKFTPVLSETSKQFLGFASTAAVAGGIIAGVNFSVDSLMEYEKGVQSFRTIVSDLSDKEFAKYQSAIDSVADKTKKSSIVVAQSFETIAGLNAKFAETAEGISAVAEANITLAKASRSDLGPSAENLVGIMNQFDLAANQAGRTIDVLAAGQAVGAANISQTAESFKNFGSVAKAANIPLEQSVALIQTVGKFSVLGAEAGTKLRGSVLKLQQAGLGYASGQFNINDALAEAQKKISKLTTAKKQDALLTKLFGAENISTGRILLSNIQLFQDYTKAVTGQTGAAKVAADINSNSLAASLDELKASWVNMLTGNQKANATLKNTRKIVQYVTRNLETIVSVGTKILIFFAAWKALIIASRIALIAYNISLGIMSALSTTASVAVGQSTIALAAYSATTRIATAAQWALNLAMDANPIGLIILAIAALIALVVVAVKHYNEWGAALLLIIGPIGLIVNLVQSIRRNWDLITKSFHDGGMIAGIKMIGKTILDALLMPLQQVIELIARITGAQWATDAVASLTKYRASLGLNTTTDESGKPLSGRQLVNPEVARQEAMVQRMESTNTQNVKIDINDKTGQASMASDSGVVPVKLSSTVGFKSGAGL